MIPVQGLTHGKVICCNIRRLDKEEEEQEEVIWLREDQIFERVGSKGITDLLIVKL